MEQKRPAMITSGQLSECPRLRPRLRWELLRGCQQRPHADLSNGGLRSCRISAVCVRCGRLSSLRRALQGLQGPAQGSVLLPQPLVLPGEQDVLGTREAGIVKHRAVLGLSPPSDLRRSTIACDTVALASCLCLAGLCEGLFDSPLIPPDPPVKGECRIIVIASLLVPLDEALEKAHELDIVPLLLDPLPPRRIAEKAAQGLGHLLYQLARPQQAFRQPDILGLKRRDELAELKELGHARA
mmetsp:Transcript_122505/g.261403  ORF Transcript_122505/g.261403 Transcript_122505/m.261403 type:complete len:241 (-) Transcript_122505:104-826(-)